MKTNTSGYLALILMLFAFHLSYAQGKVVSGTVTDTDGIPLPGVNIVVKGTTQGTQTDFDGNYSINVEQGQVLEFSYVGYANMEREVGEGVAIDVTMEQDTNALDEIVVVGYGTQRARDVSTAISSIGAKDFKRGVILNPIDQISGKLPGLEVTNSTGDPNQSRTIRLRGQASLTGGQDPLVVLDGVPLDNIDVLDNIPAGDIASYDVLKDASATAIYGSRGANGVIMVQTKQGRKGKSEIQYSGNIGISKIAKTYDMLNAAEWKEGAKSVGASQATIDNRDKGADTKWIDALTRTAVTTSHNVSISGGGDDFSYFGSTNYISQEGIVRNTGKEQMGINFRGEKRAFDDKLSVKLGINHSVTKREYVDPDLFSVATTSLPTFPVYNEDGSYYAFSDFNQYNVVMHQEEQEHNGKENYTVVYGSVDYKLDDVLEGLSVGALGSITRFSRDSTWFRPSFPVENNINRAKISNRNRESKQGNFHINFDRNWGEHHLDFSLVHEYTVFSNDYFSASGQDYAFEDSQAHSLQNGDPAFNQINSYKSRYTLSSFLGRFSYNYARKYYLNINYRRDGSSKFGTNNRWGDFYAVSGAWRISGEDFMSGANWVNDLKLRGGYGVTGNQDAIDPYRTRSLLGNVGRYYDGASDSYKIAYGPMQNSNPDLKWEEVHEANVGLDFQLFDHRVRGNFNYFHKETKNLLFNYKVPVPPFQVSDMLANVGTMVNKGQELQIDVDIIRGKDFNWSAMGQITFIDTEIKSLSGSFSGFELSTEEVPAGNAKGRGMNDQITFLKPGYAPYVFRLPHYVGVDADGNQLFDDGNGGQVTRDGLTTSMYNYYDPSRDFTYGFGTNLSYKNWGLSMFFRGVKGQKIFNNTRLQLDNISRLPGNNMSRRGLQSEIKDGPRVSDLWLEKAGFLRLDNVSLAYTFDQIKMFDSLRLSFTANNLFVITNYHGLDPEVRIANSNVTSTTTGAVTDQSYIDSSYQGDGYYPKSRTFNFGVELTF